MSCLPASQLSDLASPSDAVNFRWVVSDPRLTNAVWQVQKDYCQTYEKKMSLTCSLSEMVVGDILLSYIEVLTSDKTKGEFTKSFFDEANDRTDPYRAKLVKKVAQLCSQPETLTLGILVALYWAVKHRRLQTNAILKPLEAGITGGAEYDMPIIGPMVKAGRNIIDGAGNIIGSAGEGMKDTLNAASATLKWLPWILGAAGGILVLPKVTPFLLSAKQSAKTLSGKSK